MQSSKRKRRGHHEGSITERADGRWHVRIDLGRGIDGKRRTKHAYAATATEATDLLRRLGGRAVNGQLLTPSTPTVAAYLEDWFTTHSDDWKPTTQRSYRGAIDTHLVPAFGPYRLEQLTPAVIQQWLVDHKKAHGARRRITLAHATLRAALSRALKLQLVSINAAALVSVPRPTARPIAPLSPDQARVFLAAAQSHRLSALFSVALACGLRLGEATGLTWNDVDLQARELRVRQQLQPVPMPGKKRRELVLLPLKTDKSRRTLVLPDVCVTALRTYRTQQLAERLKAGARWVDTNLVFTTFSYREQDRCGLGLHPKNVLRTLHRILAAAEPPLPRCRFHDLRHSAASLLLAEGVQLSEISLLLGHSEIRLTADLYAHLQRETAAKAASHMDAILTR